MKYLLLFLVVYFSSLSIAQTNDEWNNLLKAESFIYLNEMDSASFYLKKVPTGEYVLSVSRIVDGSYSNNDLWIFIRESLSYNLVENRFKIKFIDSKIKAPLMVGKLDLDFFKVRSEEYFYLMNSDYLKEAAIVLSSLEHYYSSIEKDNSDENKYAEFLLKKADIIFTIIKREEEKGLDLCEQNIKIARELNDTLLLQIAGNLKAEFLLYKNDLSGYISLMQEMIFIGNQSKTKSNILYKNTFNLISAKTYRGDDEKEIIPLIKSLYFNPRMRVKSFYLIIEQLSKSEQGSDFYLWVFNEFEVDNVIELTKKMIAESESQLFPNDVYQIMRVSANLLLQNKHYKEAFNIKDESVAFNKTIYAKELSNSIAENEIEKNELENQIIIKAEQEKATMYWNIMAISIVGLVFLILGILLLRKKNIKLRYQKIAIEKKDFEKQLLLKEIHHRVKNNFQIVSSLLQLQTKGIDDQKAIDLATEGQNRVKAMALIHQKLYQNDELTVRFQEYVKSLVADINKAYAKKSVNVEINIPADYSLDIDTSIPLGLILNELITNSYKYAFSSDKDNRLDIHLVQGDELQTLIVKDNGKGIDENIDLNKVKSIGLRLVKNLSKQLHGTFSYKVEKGTVFTITYKETEYRELED